jgi:hypothetical protein
MSLLMPSGLRAEQHRNMAAPAQRKNERHLRPRIASQPERLQQLKFSIEPVARGWFLGLPPSPDDLAAASRRSDRHRYCCNPDGHSVAELIVARKYNGK